MTTPLPLRQRFALLALLLGLVLGGLGAAAVLIVAEEYETILANEILRGQAEDYGERLVHQRYADLPQTHRLRGFHAGDADLPPAYAGMPPGLREDPANEDIHVGVFDARGGRLVFVMDLSDIEAMERRLSMVVAIIVVLETLLAGWLGWLLAGIALRPLQALARQVEALPAQPQATQLAAQASRDELGRLAVAIDDYQARLVDADVREQAFLADASHELRTPLTVIQGVGEVLLDDASATPAQRVRLARLERGIGEMRRLLEAMLATARRKPLQVETVAADELLRRAAETVLAGHPGAQARIDASGQVQVAVREADLLLAGLARRLVQQQGTGALLLVLEQKPTHCFRLWVEGGSEAAAPAADSARADVGSGSALLDRLALRLGWQVEFRNPREVTVRLSGGGSPESGQSARNRGES